MSSFFGVPQPIEIKNVVQNIITRASGENITEKIKNASPDLLFRIIVIGIIIISFLIKFKITSDIILSIFLVILVLYVLLLNGRTNEISRVASNKNDILTLNGKINQKYHDIFGDRYNTIFYKNPALVKIFTSMLPFARMDTINFKDALIATNQLIRIYESAKLGHKVPNQTIDIAEALQRNIMNSMQSMINSFPTTVMPGYRFQIDLEILQKILQKIIDNIKLIYEYHYEKNGPDIYNPPPSIRSGPWSNPLNEKDYNKYWSFYY